MSESWAVVLIAGAGTVVLKAAGPVLLGGRVLPPRLTRMLSLLAPAVFAALVVTGTFGSGRSLVVDERIAGLVAAAAAIALRAPLTLAVAAAAAAAAVARLG